MEIIRELLIVLSVIVSFVGLVEKLVIWWLRDFSLYFSIEWLTARGGDQD